MNRMFWVGCCLIAASAGLGYWVVSGDRPASQLTPVAIPSAAPRDDNPETPEIYAAINTGEVIDLSRAFEPTGEELDLRTLLDARPQVELGPMPRESEPEPLPVPRLSAYQEEAQSLPTLELITILGRTAGQIIAVKCVEWFSQTLPLKGLEIALPDNEGS